MVTLKLELDGEQMTFSIPESWSEVTVEQFAKIFTVNPADMTSVERAVRIVNIFTDVDEDYLYMMSPEQFNQVAEIISFTNSEIQPTGKESIIVEGDEYFIKKDFNQLTMGEVISLELLIEQSNGNIGAKMAEMLCVFLRKKREDGKLEGFKKSFMQRAEMFKHVSVADVNDIFVFFSDGENLSSISTKASLESGEK